MSDSEPKLNDLKLVWIAQLGVSSTFDVKVESVEEAIKLADILAAYDNYQFKNNIKPDYCNMGFLQQYEVDVDDPTKFAWYDYYNDDGEGFDEIRQNRE